MIKFNLIKSINKIWRNEPDIYIISYPKSGRTWLRALIGKYLSLKYDIPNKSILLTELITKKSNLPITSFTHDESAMNAKTNYQQLSYDRKQYTNKKVVLLGRDIKDTLVSAYFQATLRINVFEGTLSEFIRTEQFGVLKIITFYNIWIKNKNIPNSFLFVRYEDLHKSPEKTLIKILTFIGEENINENFIEESIEYCSFDNLKKIEKKNGFQNSILKARDNSNPNSFKVRRGKMKGYTEYLSKSDENFIDKTIAEHDFDFYNFNQ